MRVLVTGGAGFIGSHLVDSLVEENHEVAVLDNLDPQVHGEGARPRHIEQHLAARRVLFHHADVTDLSALAPALDGVEVVVHLAAAVGVGQSMYSPLYYVHANSEGTGVLLEAIGRRGLRPGKLIVASSMSLYGEGSYACHHCGEHDGKRRTDEQLSACRWEVECTTCGRPLDPVPTPETKSPELTSIYAATKKHQEDLCISYGRAHGICTFAFRFFNVYGRRQSLSNPYTGVAAIFLSRLLNDKPPVIFEDGLQSRDFIDVRDVVRCLQTAVRFDGGGTHVLNVGTGRRTTILDVANALSRALGKTIEPEILSEYRVGDIRHCIADPSRALEVLGFSTKYDLEDGLGLLVEWSRAERASDALEQGLGELRRSGLVR
jgi:dTDP-L-rhamnose 4-epimerase